MQAITNRVGTLHAHGQQSLEPWSAAYAVYNVCAPFYTHACSLLLLNRRELLCLGSLALTELRLPHLILKCAASLCLLLACVHVCVCACVCVGAYRCTICWWPPQLCPHSRLLWTLWGSSECVCVCVRVCAGVCGCCTVAWVCMGASLLQGSSCLVPRALQGHPFRPRFQGDHLRTHK